jgi:hypothetical protein
VKEHVFTQIQKERPCRCLLHAPAWPFFFFLQFGELLLFDNAEAAETKSRFGLGAFLNSENHIGVIDTLASQGCIHVLDVDFRLFQHLQNGIEAARFILIATNDSLMIDEAASFRSFSAYGLNVIYNAKSSFRHDMAQMMLLPLKTRVMFPAWVF